MIDFVNIKIKSVQSFRGVYRDRIYVCIFTEGAFYICMNIYDCAIFLIHKQKLPGDKRTEERTKIKTTKSNALN
jgi:hypothetical protein